MECQKNTEIFGHDQRMNQQGGYGIVYREIMRNKNLTVESKAIYAYLCSFAGNRNECYPGIELMALELCISKDRLYRHLNILINAGIVQKTQSRNGNRWGKSVYRICHGIGYENTCFECTENTHTQNAEIEKSGNANQDLNSNSTNSNRIKEYYEKFYYVYPRKGTTKEKESSLYWFEDALKNSGYSFEQIYKSTLAFAAECGKIYSDRRSIPGISNFFNEHIYEKYL